MNRAVAMVVLLISTSLIGRSAFGEETGADWPQWRGPGSRGVAESAVPMEWNGAKNIVWKVPVVGKGHSSPVVSGDRVFLTTAIAGEEIEGAQAPVHYLGGEEFKHPDSLGDNLSHTFKVLAFSTEDGSVLWEQTAYEGRVFDGRHKDSSYASPTVATDGVRVFAYFGSEGMFAYDVDGKPLWSRTIGQIATIGMGVGTSPVIAGGRLIVQADEGEGKASFIHALDPATGETLWKTERDVQVSWTTPLVVVDSSGREQILTSGYDWLVSYDPKTGRELWRSKGLESNSIHQPMQFGDLAIFSAGYPTKITAAVRIDGSEERRERVWSYNKGTAYVASPVAYDGRVYLTTDAGVMTCLDALTGEVIYEGGRVPIPGSHMASLLVASGRILQINRDGDAAWIKAGPVHEVLASNSVDEPVYATPAIVGGRIYLRSIDHLWAIGITD
jgi:outer membrane protein assembly factor BamB